MDRVLFPYCNAAVLDIETRDGFAKDWQLKCIVSQEISASVKTSLFNRHLLKHQHTPHSPKTSPKDRGPFHHLLPSISMPSDWSVSDKWIVNVNRPVSISRNWLRFNDTENRPSYHHVASVSPLHLTTSNNNAVIVGKWENKRSCGKHSFTLW